MKQEQEKQQRRGRSDWPGAEKDIWHVEEQVRSTLAAFFTCYKYFPIFLETQEARQSSMDANRTAQQLRREEEIPEVRQARLDACRTAQQLRRVEETPEARQERLDADRAAQQFRRDRETPETRQGRLDADKAAQQFRRDRDT